MNEYLEKIMVDGCAGLKCTGCPLYCFCREEGHPISTELIKWAAKGMLYEMEQNSRKIFDWLYELQTETNEEITVIFDHFNCIEGFPVTLVKAERGTLYFDIEGVDVRLERHECSEVFSEEKFRLTDVLTARYIVVQYNPVGGDK